MSVSRLFNLSLPIMTRLLASPISKLLLVGVIKLRRMHIMRKIRFEISDAHIATRPCVFRIFFRHPIFKRPSNAIRIIIAQEVLPGCA